jgi:endonuclease G, mitochondrial
MTTAFTNTAFSDTVRATQHERSRVRQLVDAGRWREAEPDPARAIAFGQRRAAAAVVPGAESIQGSSNDLQQTRFLTLGGRVLRAVAFVEVSTPSDSCVGTGFMVSSRLLLTNAHVIPNDEAALGAMVTFDREGDERGRPRPTTAFQLDPAAFALYSPEDQLDYALVAVGSTISGAGRLEDYGCCRLSEKPDKHVLGMAVNIVQHPGGLPKMVALRNNLLTHRTDRTLLYETDTQGGSSGAPVFNDEWELIALHHWGQPFLERVDADGNALPVQVNEGVRISAIYRDLAQRLPTLPEAWQSLLREALERDPAQQTEEGPRLSPPRPRTAPTAVPHPAEHLAMPIQGDAMPEDPVTVRFTVPLEITVRLGGSTRAAASVSEAQDAPRLLSRGAEALRVDGNYANRNGYAPGFLEGHDLPLPSLKDANWIAPLRAGEPNADKGELRYQHFSLKLHRTRRVALFTATNIDGETYLRVNRKTGRVSGNAEGETWFRDPRVSAGFYLDQSFYSEWSTYFDRGHLTRRTDPTWGDVATAERANADTFHFTNCSPQHFRFNQTTQYWQGLERYVLENGLFQHAPQRRLVVFQGPVYDDTIDLWADDVQIPSSFWKIVVWAGEAGLKAVGLVADQLPLLGEPRRNLGEPRDQAQVDVSQWRTPITTIEARTGLEFADAIRAADTIADSEQPDVGAEGAGTHRVSSWKDLVL